MGYRSKSVMMKEIKMSVVDHGSQGVIKFVVVLLVAVACLYAVFGYLPY